MITELVPVAPIAGALAEPIPDVVAAFLRAAKATTHKARLGDLRDFAGFAGVGIHAAVDGLVGAGHGRANQVAYAYRLHLEARGLSPATVARRLASLRAVVALHRTWGKIDWSLDVPAPRVECYRDTRGPGDDGWDAVRRLAAAEASAGSPRAVRDRAILLVSHDLGLRVAELASLDLEHIERDGRGLPTAIWIQGKGRLQRERLTLPIAAAEALNAWLRVRDAHAGPAFHRLDRPARDAKSGPLAMDRLTTRSIERMVKAVGKRAGLKDLWPHGLRHHAITRALDKTNGDVRRVRSFSRHKRVETLMRYDDNRRDDAGAIAALVGE
jgi:integrase/recombinase XerC